MEYFTALHGMAVRTSREKSVCLSFLLLVCLFVKRVNCDKTEESGADLYETSFILVLREEE